MELLTKGLADFDNSPTVQALLLLTLVLARYLVAEALTRRAAKRQKKKERAA